MATIGGLLLLLLAVTLFGLVVAFVLVPLFKGIGWLIGGFFGGIGWLVRHVFEFVAGMLKDSVRLIGAVIAWVVLLPLVLISVVIGRWSGAGHFFRSMNRECKVGTACLYRVALQRPLRFLLLGGLLEGLEQRVNEAMVAAPTADTPSRRTGSFDGYTIVGSLPGGGSGAKLYIARPDEPNLIGREVPERVVIKSFTLTDGSTLPQIVRESRALEAAKQLGLVLDHGMDEHRFFYVMPYHQGEHLGIITRQLHGESGDEGLSRQSLGVVFGYLEDLLRTLLRYHDGGLWHKDVKPENVIVYDGRAHLVDLGLVTPLRSAMTLTTHGTEYFRDPEMVRMALRGVKVHQVDGAKFDIFALGAVLYFVTENTFPAHGGLSAFSKKSPESVRWIIRRAMADYNKRYETAQQMLADLVFVRRAADPFAVKPAELPSIVGRAPADLLEEPLIVQTPEAGETVASARSPKPPPTPAEGQAKDSPAADVYGWGVRVGPEGVQVGRLGGRPTASGSSRPRLGITNWWTGKYSVEDSGAAVKMPSGAGGPFGTEARAFRMHARAMRQQAEQLRRQVRHRAVSARRAAREQIKSARLRAREMQRRVRGHRRHTPPKQQPPASVGWQVAVLMLVGATALVFLTRPAGHAVEESTHINVVQLPAATYLAPDLAADGRRLTLLLVNDHPAATNLKVRKQISRIIEDHRNNGWIVIVDDRDAEVAIRAELPTGPIKPNEPVSLLLRNALLKYDLAGVLKVNAKPGDAKPHERTVVTRIEFSDEDE